MKNTSFLHQLKLVGNAKCSAMQQNEVVTEREDASSKSELSKQIQDENLESNLLKLNFKLIDIDTAFGN